MGLYGRKECPTFPNGQNRWALGRGLPIVDKDRKQPPGTTLVMMQGYQNLYSNILKTRNICRESKKKLGYWGFIYAQGCEMCLGIACRFIQTRSDSSNRAPIHAFKLDLVTMDL